MKLHFFELEYRLLHEKKKRHKRGKHSCLCLNKCEKLHSLKAVKEEAVRGRGPSYPTASDVPEKETPEILGVQILVCNECGMSFSWH